MGNLNIRKLKKPKRLFAGKSNHKHDYTMPVNVEINSLDNFGTIVWVRYYSGMKCLYCNALLLGEYMPSPIMGLYTIRLKTNHTHRIDITDIELM